MTGSVLATVGVGVVVEDDVVVVVVDPVPDVLLFVCARRVGVGVVRDVVVCVGVGLLVRDVVVVGVGVVAVSIVVVIVVPVDVGVGDVGVGVEVIGDVGFGVMSTPSGWAVEGTMLTCGVVCGVSCTGVIDESVVLLASSVVVSVPGVDESWG